MMNILLIGDYSGVHADLATRLRQEGLSVTLASDGDGYRNFPRDINIGAIFKGNRWTFHLLLIWREILFLIKVLLRRYDVVQILNVSALSSKISELTWWLILRKKARFYLLVCGDDTVVVQYYLTDHLTTDYGYDMYTGKHAQKDYANLDYFRNPSVIKIQKQVMQRCAAIIALSTEVMRPYIHYGIEVKYIPIAVNVDKIAFKENLVEDKVRILHTINTGREIFKGTPLIIEALSRIQEKYKDQVTVTFSRNVPFNEYIDLINESNIVLDQTYGFSPGMNALYLMLAGRVVCSGCEKEYLDQIHFNGEESPLVNIRPNVEHIYNQVEKLILNREKIPEIGLEARKYVIRYHNIDRAVNEFIKIWNS